MSGAKILAGLADAVAYAKGDKTRGRLVRVKVEPDFEARVRAFHDAMEAEFGVQWSQRKMDAENQDRVRAVVKALENREKAR